MSFEWDLNVFWISDFKESFPYLRQYAQNEKGSLNPLNRLKSIAMDRYFTIMVVPEREKGVRSFRIPRVVFHATLFFMVIFVVLLGILTYDYWKILRQVYENKHLTIENRQLKEQVQLFQMKLNSLTEDLERIHTFEKKLRIITGIEEADLTQGIKSIDSGQEEYPLNETDEKDTELDSDKKKKVKKKQTKIFENLDELKTFSSATDYLKLKDLYE
ncbi:MAG: hypothetical protein NXH75_11820 [Halobacteriovoraceae bacterium]|nr:hypothetical protein [Halobacteriovoraceae bacterium]